MLMVLVWGSLSENHWARKSTISEVQLAKFGLDMKQGLDYKGS